ncbi:MAG: DNA helicase HerA-like ATPase [Lentimonas sp.]|jgi:DNA helicase HerA-like ATPase
MSKLNAFKEELTKGYTFKKDSITIGGAMLDGVGVPGLHVKVPLKTLNRHGLIAGATGTGKTKTLQVFAEQLSEKGIPSLLMDIKGDLSGLAAPGVRNDFIAKRHAAIELPYEPKPMPVELMTLTEGDGVKLKATVTEFGPVLLSKILGLNDTQSSIISMVFMFCDKRKLPLIDLKDLRKTLQYLANEGKEEIEKEYGGMSSTSVNTIMRKVIELEQQGAEKFFGEKSFDPNDLLRKDANGNGVISIIRLMDIQGKPKLFSTFMLSLMAEIYNTFPEQGDSDEPKLCIFIDEAHLVFEEASDALMDQLEVIIKLIRSKGVGIYFCTQNPDDVPEAILSQLGLKVQHALRAFTEKDRKAIRKASENYPITEFYKTDEIITKLGIGEALVTALNEKGIPTPLAVTICRAPLTRMGILEKSEVKNLVDNSDLVRKYGEEIDRESAYEILNKKIEKAANAEEQEKKHETIDKEIAELKKAEDKRLAAKEKELARLKREQIKTEREKEKNQEKFWKDISRAATRKTRDTSLFGTLARGILGVLGVK